MKTHIPPQNLTTPDLLAAYESAEWAFNEHGSDTDARYAAEILAELDRRAEA